MSTAAVPDIHAPTIEQPEVDMPAFDPATMSEDGFMALAAGLAPAASLPPPPAPETPAITMAAPVTTPVPPAPVPAAPAAPAAVEPPAPVEPPAVQPPADPNAIEMPEIVDGKVVFREKSERRVYLSDPKLTDHARLAMAITARNPDLLPDQVAALVNEKLGIAPRAHQAAPNPPDPEPEPQLSPLDQVKSKLAEIDGKLTGEKKLHPTFDADEYSQAMTERQNLLVEQMRLETADRVQEQLAAQAASIEIARVEAQVKAEFGVLSDLNHPFTMAYELQKQHLLANAPDEVVGSPTFELDLARQMADQFEKEYQFSVRKPGTPAAPAATTAPAPTAPPANVTQQPVPAAAPQPQAPAAPPRSAAVPLSGTPASVNPVMGIQQPNAPQDFMANIPKTGAIENADAFGEQMLSAFFGGQSAPLPAFRAAA